MDKRDIIGLQKRIGYEFRDRSLLIQALTHASYANEHGCEDNERMEFLGDSILEFVVSVQLYFSDKDEGEMTVRRSRIVSRGPLALAAERLGLVDLMRMGVGAEREPLSVKLKSNLFEAVLGAIYLDSRSIEPCEKFVKDNLGSISEKQKDHKSALQEYVQGAKLGKIVYVCEQVENARTSEFRAKVSVDGKEVGVGYGFRKKDAEKEAAKAALDLLTAASGK